MDRVTLAANKTSDTHRPLLPNDGQTGQAREGLVVHGYVAGQCVLDTERRMLLRGRSKVMGRGGDRRRARSTSQSHCGAVDKCRRGLFAHRRLPRGHAPDSQARCEAARTADHARQRSGMDLSTHF